jgi:hypothetical protein
MPRTVAPTATTTITVENMCAPWLCVVQSLEPLVVCSVV